MLRNIEPQIAKTKEVLQLAAEMSKAYYKAPLILAYSGGKDSDVMLRIAMDCLDKNDFEVINSHTSVDAPETVYYIRQIFDELESKGIKATVHIPRDKDGKQITMWSLIVKKKMPPTRVVRYCCQYLKESSTPNRMTAVGVRADESRGRGGREAFTSFGGGGGERKGGRHFSLSHAQEVYKQALSDNISHGEPIDTPSPMDCTMIANMKAKNDTVVSPIYEWSEYDIWNYLQTRNLPHNPMYDKGYKRVGCVGCPLGGRRNMIHEFADYPQYKENYIRAFDRMLKHRAETGKEDKWKSGKDVFNWWIGEWDVNVYGQMTIEEMMKEDTQ